MKQLTFFEERNIKAEWEELIEPYLKGISGGCYLCPVRDLCKDHWNANGTYRSKSADNLEDVMAHIIDNGFDNYYKKWKLDMLHKMLKRERRELWKEFNHYDGYSIQYLGEDAQEEIDWSRHWIESLEQIEQEQRWDWTLEEEWTNYRKWKKKNDKQNN